jgi:hypothetical protein
MKRPGRLLPFLCLSIALFLPQAATVAAQDDDPLSMVREIYLQYGEGGELFDVPEKYFSPSLLQLWRDVEAGDDEGDVEAALGFPVFNNAGDDETIEIDDVLLQMVAKKYVIASYVVLVDEKNAIAATKKYFQYNFEDTPEGWKIDNIDWGRDKQTLRQYLSEIKALREMK